MKIDLKGLIMRSKYEKITIRPKDEIIIRLIETLEMRGTTAGENNIESVMSCIEELKWVLSIDDETLENLRTEHDEDL